ncbi:MAG TPA: MBL fold metallo-hydrolase [Myxococcota bacterium]|jgi:glyoxylase-like metal-dependent hydrolase (beta-lactamase superfamily II)|nr:MBL fold metallo-hydrolase [Myxococcota bacterium]
MATPPFPAPRPLLARLTSPSGPPRAGVHRREGATVMAVPNRYSVTYLLAGPQAVTVVDVGSIADVPRVLEALAWLGRPASQVDAVVATHLHFDHVMGVDDLARRLDVPVVMGAVAHRTVASGRPPRFPDRQRRWHAWAGWPMQGMPLLPGRDWREGLAFGTPWGRNPFRARVAPPPNDGDLLPGQPGWRLLETPGHSDDAICLFHEASGFLVCGDTIRNFLGGEWNPLWTDADAYAATRARLLALPVRTVFPGHGPVLDGPDVLQRVRLLPPYLP